MQHRSPVPSRIGWDKEGFQDELSSALCAIACSPIGEHADSFSSSLQSLRMGPLDAFRYEGHGLKDGRRSLQQIRRDGVDDFIFLMPLTAPALISQCGQTATIAPGACGVLSTARPFIGVCGAPAYAELMARVPGPLLRKRVPHIDTCCVQSIDVGHGAGRVMRNLLETLIDERQSYVPAQADSYGPILLDTIVNAALNAPEWPRGERLRQSARSRVFSHACEFVESRLSDPMLSPEEVARHCRVSISFLYAAFAANSIFGVATFIRESRLQCCRDALRNSLLRHQSAMEIALRWGFNSAPSFTRAYRARYGVTPSADRKQQPTVAAP